MQAKVEITGPVVFHQDSGKDILIASLFDESIDYDRELKAQRTPKGFVADLESHDDRCRHQLAKRLNKKRLKLTIQPRAEEAPNEENEPNNCLLTITAVPNFEETEEPGIIVTRLSSGENEGTEFVIELESWDETGAHKEARLLEGLQVTATLEVID